MASEVGCEQIYPVTLLIYFTAIMRRFFCVMTRLAVLIESRFVTDRQTDRHGVTFMHKTPRIRDTAPRVSRQFVTPLVKFECCSTRIIIYSDLKMDRRAQIVGYDISLLL